MALLSATAASCTAGDGPLRTGANIEEACWSASSKATDTFNCVDWASCERDIDASFRSAALQTGLIQKPYSY